MLTSRAQRRAATLLLQLFLLIAQHTLYCIHRQEISIALRRPLMILDSALFELLLCLTVGLREIVD